MINSSNKRKKILITSALPYANGHLHFGHIAGAYLPADVYARFQRMQKNEVLYVCGSDEYGFAVSLSAKMANRSIQEHVDLHHQLFQKLFQQMHISFDHYSRTTCQKHRELAQNFFLDLLEKKHIEERISEQLYSPDEKMFLADRYVVGTCPQCDYKEARGDECTQCGSCYEAIDLKNPRSKISGKPLEKKATIHWFLLLDQFKEPLHSWLETKSWKDNVYKFAKNFIKELRPRAITRDSSWGIPLPIKGYEGKVLYVWFDAPIGYISATQEWAENRGTPDAWKDYWKDPQTKLVHFIGKDNIPFHAAIFPAMIMGQSKEYKLVDELPANEFYMLEGKQFSKSEGWLIDMDDFFTRYTSDQIRYTIATTAPEVSDSEFTWRDFQQRCNGDLLGKYGNFAHRTLQFIQKYCQGKTPPIHNLAKDDQQFLHQINNLVQDCASCYERFTLRGASRLIIELAQQGNMYFDHKKVWLLRKKSENREQMENALACCLECLKNLALISYPIIPATAEKLWNMIGYDHATSLQEQDWNIITATKIEAGKSLPQPKILFRKIEEEEIAREIEKLQTDIMQK